MGFDFLTNAPFLQEAYKGLRVTPAAAIRPSHRSLGDNSAFKGSTENRDSFTPKPLEHVTGKSSY